MWPKVEGELICSGDDLILGESVKVVGLEWDTEYLVKIYMGHKEDGYVHNYSVHTYYGTEPPVLYLNNYDIQWEYDAESGEIKITPIEGWVDDATKLEYILQKSLSDTPSVDDPRWTDVLIGDDMKVTIDCASYNDGLPEYDSKKGGYYLHLFTKMSGDLWARPICMYYVSIKINGVR